MMIYVTYEDDGSARPGSQDGSTFPTKVLLIFPDMVTAKEYEEKLESVGSRKNPRFTGFYSENPDEQLMGGCWAVNDLSKGVNDV